MLRYVRTSLSIYIYIYLLYKHKQSAHVYYICIILFCMYYVLCVSQLSAIFKCNFNVKFSYLHNTPCIVQIYYCRFFNTNLRKVNFYTNFFWNITNCLINNKLNFNFDKFKIKHAYNKRVFKGAFAIFFSI